MVVMVRVYGHGVEGQYLRAYDPEAHGGRGYAVFTQDPSQALTFATVAEAQQYCWRQPAARPVRDDGKPNRPLTAFSIEFVIRQTG